MTTEDELKYLICEYSFLIGCIELKQFSRDEIIEFLKRKHKLYSERLAKLTEGEE